MSVPPSSFRARCLLLWALMASITSEVSGASSSWTAEESPTESAPSFSREIRPILSNNCFFCHGPDEKVREADVRIDQRRDAFRDRGDYALIVPGKPEESELYLRISDPDDPMPPENSGKALTAEQIASIKSWIEAGAVWDEHWAYQVPRRQPVPESDSDWARNDIDRFIIGRLASEGLAPEPEADPETLLRRLTLDLTGLPPTLEELDAFLGDESGEAYERQVDRLLGSPRFGEHVARAWLDAARYGDTHGFHLDNERQIWPYRDWVIDSLNDNKPFDRFTIEQLAGDLFPDATIDQHVATGFQRLNPTTAEGGFIEEEYLVKYAVDRVETMSTVFMGTTVVCAQCHDHKYDPVSQKEFYELFAFFNNTAEAASDGNQPSPAPIVKVPSLEQVELLAQFEERTTQAETRLDEPLPEVDARQTDWEHEWRERLAQRWEPLEVRACATREGTTLRCLEDGSIVAEGENPDREMYEILAHTDLAGVTALRLEVLTEASAPLEQSVGRAVNGNFVLGDVQLQAAPGGRPSAFVDVPLVGAAADHSQDNWPITATIDQDPGTGWAILPAERADHTALFVPGAPLGEQGGSLLRLRLGFDSVHAKHSLARFRLWASSDVALTPARFDNWYTLGPFPNEEKGDIAFDRDYGVETTPIDPGEPSEAELRWSERPEWRDGEIHTLEGEICATYLFRELHVSEDQQLTLALGSDDAIKVWCNTELVLSERVARPAARDQNRVTLSLKAGVNRLLMKIVNFGGGYGFVTEVVDEAYGGLPLDIAHVLERNTAPTPEQEHDLRRFFRQQHSPEYEELLGELEGVQVEAAALEAEIPSTLVAEERMEIRPAHVLIRGNYTRKGEEVTPDTPSFLPPLGTGDTTGDTEKGRRTRMDLARWLVDGKHPLTARVTVNRLWQELFGIGLVKTSEDFGSQGEFPAHPELLDYLALEFSEGGWDIKAWLKQVVMSATYRQVSSASEAKRTRDPENRLLARGPRFRMEAERIRDSVLAISGLLVEKIGGPSVRPYQPDGIWEAVGYTSSNTARYMRESGEALYRRSLYTFWKRTAPPAGMQIFDAPSREGCVVARTRTNTPLQALALLNDTQYVEAARAFAERILTLDGLGDRERMTWAFRCVTSRRPTESELEVLGGLLESERAAFGADAESAASLVQVGESAKATMDLGSDGQAPSTGDWAAWTVVCNLLFNLDEFVTKE